MGRVLRRRLGGGAADEVDQPVDGGLAVLPLAALLAGVDDQHTGGVDMLGKTDSGINVLNMRGRATSFSPRMVDTNSGRCSGRRV